MRLADVRCWARARGIGAAHFRRVHDAALLHVISRVLQAIYRESGVARLSSDARGRWHLKVGRGLSVPASGPLPFRRLEITASRWRTAGGFLRALCRALAGTEYSRVFKALRSDFGNSHANVVLNRLLGPALGKEARALEPAWQGHQYWPFPALRIGPSLEQVVACSHLCQEPVRLPLLELASCRLISTAYDSHEEFFRAWSGLEPEADRALLPLHPWQLRLSPVVRALADSISTRTVEAIPLASQRTCRILRTGYDVKLPVDATLTGEHRLLYRLNCENAALVSALAADALAKSGLRNLDFQLDVASIFHRQFGPHLSAIVRAPVRARRGERLVAAINLWTGPHEARVLLEGADPEEFFRRYCRSLLEGPVVFYAQWGMAFEPHIQNVYVGLRDGLPARIVLRDLDNSILDPRRMRRRMRALGDAAPGTWKHMPPYEDGGRRLVQAMLYGHLGEVMWRLGEDHGADPGRLLAMVDETWDQLETIDRPAVRELRGWSNAVKTTLRTRLERATTLRFRR